MRKVIEAGSYSVIRIYRDTLNDLAMRFLNVNNSLQVCRAVKLNMKEMLPDIFRKCNEDIWYSTTVNARCQQSVKDIKYVDNKNGKIFLCIDLSIQRPKLVIPSHSKPEFSMSCFCVYSILSLPETSVERKILIDYLGFNDFIINAYKNMDFVEKRENMQKLSEVKNMAKMFEDSLKSHKCKLFIDNDKVFKRLKLDNNLLPFMVFYYNLEEPIVKGFNSIYVTGPNSIYAVEHTLSDLDKHPSLFYEYQLPISEVGIEVLY